MILPHIDTTSLTKAGVRLSVELATSYYRAGTCNSVAKVMVGEWYAL